MRRLGSSYGMPARWILRKPPSSPIRAHPLRARLGDDAPVAGGVAARARVGRRRRADGLVELALRRDEPLAARAVRVVVVGDTRPAARGLGLGGRELGEHALVVRREDL